MTRSVLLALAVILALATGVGLLGVAATMREPLVAAAPGMEGHRRHDAQGLEEANIDLVHRFYAAVNAALDTGDATALDAVLAPDFVDHSDAFGGTADWASLARSLAELRAAFPDLQLAAGDLVADGDRVAVRVSAGGLRPASSLAALLPDLPPRWDTVELLRIGGGKVAERWHQGPPLGLVGPLLEASLPPLPPVPLALGLAHLTLAPGAGIPKTVVDGPVLVRVEEGTLSVRVEGSATITGVSGEHDTPRSRSIQAGGAHPLGPGEVLSIAAGSPYDLRNTGQTPTEALAIALVPTLGNSVAQPFGVDLIPSDAARGVGPPDSMLGPATPASISANPPLIWPPGVEGRYLIRLRLPALSTDGVVMTAGRATLSAGASFRPIAVDGTAVLAVEAGTVALTVGRGNAQLVRDAGGTASVAEAPTGEEERLMAGDAALIVPRTIGFARNGGDTPLVIVLVTLT